MERSKAEFLLRETLKEIPGDVLDEVLEDLGYFKLESYDEEEEEDEGPLRLLLDLVHLGFGMDFKIANIQTASDNLMRFPTERYDD